VRPSTPGSPAWEAGRYSLSRSSSRSAGGSTSATWRMAVAVNVFECEVMWKAWRLVSGSPVLTSAIPRVPLCAIGFSQAMANCSPGIWRVRRR